MRNPTVDDVDSFIVVSDLGADVGILGAIHLAKGKFSCVFSSFCVFFFLKMMVF